MSPGEWLACSDPNVLLGHVAGQASERKMRLFAVARCRRVWHLLQDNRLRDAVEAAELFADGGLTTAELHEFRTVVEALVQEADRAAEHCWQEWVRAARPPWNNNIAWPDPVLAEEEFRAADFAYCLVYAVAWASQPPGQPWWTKEHEELFAGFPSRREPTSFVARESRPHLPFQDEPAWLARDVFGGSFVERAFDARWRAWNAGTAVQIAETIYQERRFGDMPTLADALEEAGCTSVEILAHCRQHPGHVRGCWMLDLMLSKR
jgi:hypothetical protein